MGKYPQKAHEPFAVVPAASEVYQWMPPEEVQEFNSLLDQLEQAEGLDQLKNVSQQVHLFVEKCPGDHQGLLVNLSTAKLSEWVTKHSPEEIKTMVEGTFGHSFKESLHPALVTALIDPATSQSAKEKLALLLAESDLHQQSLEGKWLATPAQVLEAQNAVLALRAAFVDSDKSSDLACLIMAENKLATAWCPEAQELHTMSVNQTRKLVDQAIGAKNWTTDGLKQAAAKYVEECGLAPVGAGKYLSLYQVAQLARSSTEHNEREHIIGQLNERKEQVANFKAAEEQIASMLHKDNGIVMLQLSDADSIAAYVAAASARRTNLVKIVSWTFHPTDKQYLNIQWVNKFETSSLFKNGAKKVPIGILREAALDHGLDQQLVKKATRADLTNYLLGSFDSDVNPAAVVEKLQVKLKSTTPTVPATKAPVKVPINAAIVNGYTAGNGTWAAKHQQVKAALMHHAASVVDLPAWQHQAAVADMHLADTGDDGNLGGMHAKSVHLAPDGSKWLFKPDRLKGPRAVAEAVAAKVLHRVGVPTVPAYTRTIKGKTGVIQPIVSDVTTLKDDPRSWSQADVDAIVRYHASAWMIGDHDAKHDNILRTRGGGLVPVDHGQAFKFFGRDKLSSDYHPNSSFGARPPIWVELYQAAKEGKLAGGVQIRSAAALPVIKAFESLPEQEYRDMLTPVAEAGANSDGIHWKPAMVSRLKKRGVANPAPEQIAEEFLDLAMQRKANLRSSFHDLFSGETVAADVALLAEVA